MKLKRYHEILRNHGCVICGQPASLHHVVGGSVQKKLGCRGNEKHSDWLVIPLCHDHHQGKHGIHHVGVDGWERIYGKQTEKIDALASWYEINLWKLAEKPSKIIPHKGVGML